MEGSDWIVLVESALAFFEVLVQKESGLRKHYIFRQLSGLIVFGKNMIIVCQYRITKFISFVNFKEVVENSFEIKKYTATVSENNSVEIFQVGIVQYAENIHH